MSQLVKIELNGVNKEIEKESSYTEDLHISGIFVYDWVIYLKT